MTNFEDMLNSCNSDQLKNFCNNPGHFGCSELCKAYAAFVADEDNPQTGKMWLLLQDGPQSVQLIKDMLNQEYDFDCVSLSTDVKKALKLDPEKNIERALSDMNERFEGNSIKKRFVEKVQEILDSR